jgi:hypothetical protein
MKITRLLLVVLICSVSNLFGQAPQAINYQGIARDLTGNPLVNQAVGLQLTIHNTTSSGPVDYQETFTVTTNQFGLYTVQIGRGTPVSGTFSAIAWGTASHYLEVAMDPTGGNAYVAAGTSELISVPYALYAETSGTGGPTGATGPAGANGAAGATGPAGANGVTGTVGATGPSGDPGIAGPVGPTGSAGANGATGAVGATGPSGDPGVAGPAGPMGPMGLMGPMGPAGAVGATGANGATGAAGANGATGATGVAGANGATGATGSAGANGATGATGSAGANGATGATGAAGANGATGATGSAGANGATGATGSAGANGATGVTGVTGAIGAAGPTGAIGPVGPTGSVGAAGPTGAIGPVGPTGAVGAAGPTGAIGPVGPTGANGTNGSVGPTGPTGPGGVLGTTGYIPKFTSATTLGNSLMQDNGTSISAGLTTPSVIYQLYAYRQQLTVNGDGQSTLFGYRTRDSQNDGISYAQISANDATRGYNFWGDVYTFGVGGWNYNDYSRCGGTFGADVNGTYWGSLGYRSSALLNYGVYGSAAYANGGGRMENGIRTGIGAGFYGDLMGGWVRGDIMGFATQGSMFAAYNVGNTYNTGFHADLVKTGGSITPAFAVTSTSVKVYDDGSANLSNGTVRVNFTPEYAALIKGNGNPTVTVSPMGQCNGLYIVSIDETGFTVAEMNNGTSNISFSWISVGKRVDASDATVPSEITNPEFTNRMSGLMFNEGNKKQSCSPMWWNGSGLDYSTPPSMSREEKAALLLSEKK